MAKDNIAKDNAAIVSDTILAESGREQADTYRYIEDEINKEAQESSNEPRVIRLSAYIRQCWEAAKLAKRPFQKKMKESALQRRGEYSKSDLAKIIAQSENAIFMNITSIKCRAAKSLLMEVFLSSDEDAWTIAPTPIPELPPKLTEYVNNYIAEKIQTDIALEVIEDQREFTDYLRLSLIKNACNL